MISQLILALALLRPEAVNLMPPKPGPKQRELALRAAQFRGNGGPPGQQSAKLIWAWTGQGQVFFEVWHSNRMPPTVTITGTNVPAGFTMFTNVLSPSTDIPMDQATDFFIVRAGNDRGYSDWNK